MMFNAARLRSVHKWLSPWVEPFDDSAAPSFGRLLGEVSVVGERWNGRRLSAGLASGHDGQGRPVMVIPGFLAQDFMTQTLRRTLRQANYRPHGWKFGRNLGISRPLFEAMLGRIETLARRYDRPVALVGWSLGGLYARELAKERPELVERVVTLGSPFSGDCRQNHAWQLYEWINDHPVDAPPIEACLSEKPSVRTVALWSARDGIVSPASARGLEGEADERIEVDCTHLGFVCAPPALKAILTALED